jgi:hypothetical protein
MEQRRKIVISTGTDGEETLSTPHFDVEATLAAKPVVPLTEPVEPPTSPQNAYAAVPYTASYAPRAAKAASSPWKRSTLILIILAAVGVGIASGLAIGLYQSRNKTSAPVAAQPAAANETQQAATQIPAETTQLPQVKQPQQPQIEEVAAENEERMTAPVEEPDDDSVEKARRADKRSDERDDKRDNDKQAARDNPKRDEERAPARVVVRERPSDTPVLDEREDRIERRERRREERRAERRRQREENSDGPLNFPRSAERARQEINRIRDIFEGRQP